MHIQKMVTLSPVPCCFVVIFRIETLAFTLSYTACTHSEARSTKFLALA